MKKLISFVLLFSFLVISSNAQNNTISIKKKKPLKSKTNIEGLYYSSFVTENVEIHNQGTSYRQTRHYVYFINKNEVFLFNSSLSPRKISKKLNKKGMKMADEVGRWSLSENDIYFKVNTLDPNYSTTYRYVAKLINEKIYLSYKAAYREKTALDIYLYKYEASLDI